MDAETGAPAPAGGLVSLRNGVLGLEAAFQAALDVASVGAGSAPTPPEADAALHDLIFIQYQLDRALEALRRLQCKAADSAKRARGLASPPPPPPPFKRLAAVPEVLLMIFERMELNRDILSFCQASEDVYRTWLSTRKVLFTREKHVVSFFERGGANPVLGMDRFLFLRAVEIRAPRDFPPFLGALPNLRTLTIELRTSHDALAVATLALPSLEHLHVIFDASLYPVDEPVPDLRFGFKSLAMLTLGQHGGWDMDSNPPIVEAFLHKIDRAAPRLETIHLDAELGMWDEIDRSAPRLETMLLDAEPSIWDAWDVNRPLGMWNEWEVDRRLVHKIRTFRARHWQAAADVIHSLGTNFFPRTLRVGAPDIEGLMEDEFFERMSEGMAGAWPAVCRMPRLETLSVNTFATRLLVEMPPDLRRMHADVTEYNHHRLSEAGRAKVAGALRKLGLPDLPPGRHYTR
ncbi:hypothetical protein DFJ74DRAFT_712355 [Hyaloraphidium curvatum]|nr:hypothetical protein DFJ74DRAFT_712355 [Hyaloraphidium curvatum]